MFSENLKRLSSEAQKSQPLATTGVSVLLQKTGRHAVNSCLKPDENRAVAISILKCCQRSSAIKEAFEKISQMHGNLVKTGFVYFYSCGLSTATIEYSSPSVRPSFCVCLCLSVCLCTR